MEGTAYLKGRREVIMGKINVLGFDVANLIAAGEVVDRPSSVVKELLENSIDAEATAVTVEIQRGGVAFIRVSDNGCGMDPEDLPVAILRHATSKINTADDLGHISSLGFRGEALAAISSVSKVRIFSKPHKAWTGAVLTSEAGEVIDITETGCAAGTTIVVEDLFYNVPARRKFLKKDTTEAVAVGAVVEKIALSRPDIAIKYISDGDMKFTTPGNGNLRDTVYALFGKESAGRLLEVKRSADGVTVSGFVSEPDMFKSNRNMENFFINGRFVKSKTAMAAVEQAYKTRIPQDKFPVCILNIELNPAAVDVNVHPAKLEVKFSNERIIFEAVYYAVLNALENDIIRPELVLNPRKKPISAIGEKKAVPARNDAQSSARTYNTAEPKLDFPKTDVNEFKTPALDGKKDAIATNKRDNSFWVDSKEAKRLLGAFVPQDVKQPKAEQVRMSFSTEVPKSDSVIAGVGTKSKSPLPIKMPVVPTANDGVASKESSIGEAKTQSPASIDSVRFSESADDDVPEYIILGEAYNCYVIVQLEDRLLFVDKHAAHERIIFDELVKRMKLRTHTGQLLMSSLEIKLLEIEADAVENYTDSITSLGYAFSLDHGKNGAVAKITEVPDMLNITEATELFVTLASRLCDVGAGADAAAEEFFASRLFQSACKAAIKGGRVYDMAHIRWICDRLFVKPKEGGSVIRTCPHGRPVAFEVKKSSIDRQFARLV